MSSKEEQVRIPVVEERLRVGKTEVETGRVHVSSRVEEDERLVREVLATTQVRVERRDVDLVSEDPPAMRKEADRLVVPVYEEEMVKRFRIREEVHLITERQEQPFEEKVVLHRNTVDVKREAP